MKKNVISGSRFAGRREFIRNVLISGTGVFLVPSGISCSNRGIGASGKRSSVDENPNLITV